ncbi:MAG: hypothetical protein NT106_09205 [Candidatus Sumerlaeota bacterium]|nr:hypothetical protein [Candidatus Sumerlaeota bacterium]
MNKIHLIIILFSMTTYNIHAQQQSQIDNPTSTTQDQSIKQANALIAKAASLWNEKEYTAAMAAAK